VPNRHIPTPLRAGIVVNLPEHRLYYYPKPARGQPQQVVTFPVSIGKMDWRTPIGETRIIARQKNPVWYPTESVRREHAAAGETLPDRVPPGPDNPLGNRALRLAVGKGTYLIHGTNNPIAVGLAVTHGCIRMYPEDIEVLFDRVKVGTKVRIIDEPVKVAWVDGELLLEAHPPINAGGEAMEPDLPRFEELLAAAVGDSTVAIHWDYAREILRRAATACWPSWALRPTSRRRRRQRASPAAPDTEERTMTMRERLAWIAATGLGALPATVAAATRADEARARGASGRGARRAVVHWLRGLPRQRRCRRAQRYGATYRRPARLGAHQGDQ
jgi:hypothetical protein